MSTSAIGFYINIIFLIKSDSYNSKKKLTNHYSDVYTYYSMVTGLN